MVFIPLLREPRMFSHASRKLRVLAFLAVLIAVPRTSCFADGKLQPPRKYSGSLEERAQEALIIFKQGNGDDDAGRGSDSEDSRCRRCRPLRVDRTVPEETDRQGGRREAVYRSCSITSKPAVAGKYRNKKSAAKSEDSRNAEGGVRVLSREVVGSYDVSVVQETKSGALNGWLEANEYQPLDDASDVLEFYRKKNYVFACIKVDKTQLTQQRTVDLHPLRFTFKTGGKDGDLPFP